jgi:SnoaL-like domain
LDDKEATMSTTDPLSTMDTAARWRDTPAPEVVAQLQNLVQVYAVVTDAGRSEELAALFTPDATWNGEDLGYGSARGPADIAATVLQHFDPTRPMMHVPGPALLVAISRTEVHGVSWCLATRPSPEGNGPLIWFAYDDVFRPDDVGNWRFAARTLRLRFRTGPT